MLSTCFFSVSAAAEGLFVIVHATASPGATPVTSAPVTPGRVTVRGEPPSGVTTQLPLTKSHPLFWVSETRTVARDVCLSNATVQFASPEAGVTCVAAEGVDVADPVVAVVVAPRVQPAPGAGLLPLMSSTVLCTATVASSGELVNTQFTDAPPVVGIVTDPDAVDPDAIVVPP